MLDDDVPLMSRDYLEESAALNASLVSNEENMGDDDSFDDNIEMDNIKELSTSTCSLESCGLEYFAGYIAKKCTDNSQCQCCETFLDSSKFFIRNEQLLISFRAYITVKSSVDFGNLYVPSREFSYIFKIINFAFDKYYLQLRNKAFILDKLFSIISRSVEEKYPNWFVQDECVTHRKDLVYFISTVKIHKDTVRLGERLRISAKNFLKN